MRKTDPGHRGLAWALPLGLAIAASLGCWTLNTHVPARIYTDSAMQSVWFEADMARTYRNMINRQHKYPRVGVHPVIPTLTYSPVLLFRRGLGMNKVMAVRLYLSLIAGLCMIGIYGILRALGLSYFDTLLFAVLFFSSSTALFWLPVPETYPLGALGMLVALFYAIRTPTHPWANRLWAFGAHVLTLGVTITNWVAALAAAFFKTDPLHLLHRTPDAPARADGQHLRRFMIPAAAAFLFIAALGFLQIRFFPGADFFLEKETMEDELFWVYTPSLERVANVTHVLFVGSVVMPALSSVEFPPRRRDVLPMYLSVQDVVLGARGFLGGAAAFLWCVLLGLGVWGMRRRAGPALQYTVLCVVLTQWVLHVLYGPETFLYVAHMMPWLVVLAAHAPFSPFPRLAKGGAALLIVLLVAHNVPLLFEAFRQAVLLMVP